MAELNQQLDFLKKSIADRITGIQSRRLYYRRQTFSTYISTALLAALSSILLGLKIDKWSESIRITTMIITSLITLINTYNVFYNHKEMWIANNEALNKFYELNFELEFYEKGENPISKEKVEELKNGYQSVLNELNQNWSKSRKESHS